MSQGSFVFIYTFELLAVAIVFFLNCSSPLRVLLHYLELHERSFFFFFSGPCSPSVLALSVYLMTGMLGSLFGSRLHFGSSRPRSSPSGLFWALSILPPEVLTAFESPFRSPTACLCLLLCFLRVRMWFHSATPAHSSAQVQDTKHLSFRPFTTSTRHTHSILSRRVRAKDYPFWQGICEDKSAHFMGWMRISWSS